MQRKSFYDRPEFLAQSEVARLIPVSNHELKAASTLLATMMAVEEYGKTIIAECGGVATKGAEVKCFTEIKFAKTQYPRVRPDGLITASHGSRDWKALLEIKTGKDELRTEQIENYLDLAREQGVDAVITISNQFATLPTQPPVNVSGHKTKTVKLFHFSWMSLITDALIHLENEKISDSDQGYILSEFVRFVEHDKSKVLVPLRMPNKIWEDICNVAKQNSSIPRNPQASTIVSTWHQLVKYLALELSGVVSENVSISIPRAQTKDPSLRIKKDMRQLIENHLLSAEFDIPNAAAKMLLEIDIRGRALKCSMWLKPPKDRKWSTAVVNWFKNQLSDCENDEISLHALYGHSTPRMASLREVREDAKVLAHKELQTMPTWLGVQLVRTPGRRFLGAKTFVEEAYKIAQDFYTDAGQHLSRWIPPAPKVKQKPKENDSEIKIQKVETMNHDITSESSSRRTFN